MRLQGRDQGRGGKRIAGPLTIGITGGGSGSGKTLMAGLLLARLRGWGAIKFTRTEFYTSLIDDEETLRTPGKDTSRMLEAGAEKAIWVQSPGGEELAEALGMAVFKLSGQKGIIIEGNSAVELLKPDIVIFISASVPKGTASAVMRMADIVFLPGEVRADFSSGRERAFREDAVFCETEEACVEEVLRRVKEKVKELIKARAAGGRITCRDAREIAERLGVEYRLVGESADALGIRISACELGCF
ncbi:MAG: hypothetical protein M0Z59_10805 [Nitrospiraceae bacterium]|nr:hypothetical protein [Nitrospiraceae bacterium]